MNVYKGKLDCRRWMEDDPLLMQISLPKASFFFFFCFFGKHKSRPALTSHWKPQIKLIGRGGPAGVSPAHHWV